MAIRHSTLDERKEFYKKFDMEKVQGWFRQNKICYPQIMALDAGSETGIMVDERYKGKMLNFPSSGILARVRKLWPEDLYYDRNVYKDPELALKLKNFRSALNDGYVLGQELAFDIDPENVSDIKGKDPESLLKAFSKVTENALLLADVLRQNYSRIGFVFSGRGMHVHVFDEDAYKLNVKERGALIKKTQKFAIDPWVTRGYIRLMRLPYSLNGLVNLMVLPIKEKELKGFNPYIMSSKSSSVVSSFL